MAVSIVMAAALSVSVGGCRGCKTSPEETTVAVADGGSDESGDAGTDLVRIVGRVYSVEGPLAGVEVTVFAGKPAAVDGGAALAEAISDAEGRFVVEARVRGPVRVEARRAGYAVEAADGVGASAGSVELFLKRRVIVRGVVRVDGKARADVDVAFACSDSTATAKSGPDGWFVSPAILVAAPAALPVKCAVRASTAGLVGYLPSVAIIADQPLVVELRPGLAQSGRVVDDRGEAVAGAVVQAQLGKMPSLTTRSRLDGGFRIDGLVEGPLVLTARADDMLPGPPATVSVRRGVVILSLIRGATISGVVLDERGPPVAGVALQVVGEAADGSPLAVSAGERVVASSSPARLETAGELGVLRGTIPYPPLVPVKPDVKADVALGFVTDGRGAFRITGLPAGKVVVSASHPQFALGRSADIVLAPGAAVETRVILRRGTSLRGVVVDERGRGLGGAELSCNDLPAGRSDKGGGFVLERLAEPCTVTARLDGYRAASRLVSPMDKPPVELMLTKAEGQIAGQVLDERSMPLPGAAVTAVSITTVSLARVSTVSLARPPSAQTPRESARETRSAVSDRSGRFVLDGFSDGERIRLTVEHADYAPLADDVTVAERAPETRLTMQPGAGIDGWVRDDRSGVVPPGLRLEVEAGGRTVVLPVGRDGRFEAWGLPSGVGHLRAHAAGWAPFAVALELPAGRRPRDLTVRDVRVLMERGGRLRGRVVDANDAPLVATVVVVGTALVTHSDERGEFVFESVPVGRARVRATVGDESAEEVVDVSERIDAQTTLVVP